MGEMSTGSKELKWRNYAGTGGWGLFATLKMSPGAPLVLVKVSILLSHKLTLL